MGKPAHRPASLTPTEQYLAKMVERAVENRRRMAAEQLRQHLGVMADSLAPDTTSQQMEAAFDDAFSAVRPRRVW